jgi:hypothetical protein
MPKLANRTPLALVVDSFLVKAPDYAVCHDDRSHLTLRDKFKYLASNVGSGADVATIYIPGTQIFHVCIIGSQDADSDLCRSAQVRTVEGNRGDRVSPHSLPRFLAQALEKPIFRHIALSVTAAFTISVPVAASVAKSFAHLKASRQA